MLVELTALGIIFLAFVGGFLVGKTHNGVQITIMQKQEKPEVQESEGYNESTADMLPPEVQNYFKTTKGFQE